MPLLKCEILGILACTSSKWVTYKDNITLKLHNNYLKIKKNRDREWDGGAGRGRRKKKEEEKEREGAV